MRWMRWRAISGRPDDMASLRAVAAPDADLQVQIVASAAFTAARETTTGSAAPVDGDGRLVLQGSEDGKTLARGVKLTAARQKQAGRGRVIGSHLTRWSGG